MLVKEAIEHLQKNYKPNDVIFQIIWTTEDVFSRADDIDNPKPTQEKAEEIIKRLEKSHDANTGTTWEDIDYLLNEDKN